MRLSQSRRAVKARQWRVDVRGRRRFNTFASDFISVKYPDIYQETIQFYNSMDKMHPEKNDLTKAKEYRQWKSGIVNEQTSESDAEDNIDETPESVRNIISEMAEPEQMTTQEAVATEPEQMITQEAAATEPEQMTTWEAATESVEPDQNILQLAVNELEADNIESIEDLDSVIENIIRELQQDAHLNDYLNAERNGELLRPAYEEEDEGIGLNVETELEAIIEPFDYELEVEGENW